MSEQEVTKLYATIVPRLSKNFESDLQKQIDRAQSRVRPEVVFKAKVNQRQAQAVANQLNHISRNRTANIEAKVHTAAAGIQIAHLTRDRTVKVKVDVDRAGSDVLSNIRSTSGRNSGGNGGGRGGGLLGGSNANGIQHLADTVDNLGKSFNRLNDLAGVAGSIVSGVAKAMGTLGGLAQEAAQGTLTFGGSLAKLGAAAGAGAAVGLVVVTVLAMVAALAVGTLAVIGFSLAAVVAGAVVTALAVAVGALASAVVAALPILGGIGAAIGVIALAMKPVLGAFQEFVNIQEDAGSATGSATDQIRQQASAMRSSDAAIRAAKNGIVEANHAIELAQQGVIRAQRGLRNAGEGLRDAYDGQRRARERLNDAERKAIENLEDLRRAARDAAGNEEDAEIRLVRARERLAEMDPLNNDHTDYREALRDVEQAERDLEDTRKDNIDIVKEYQDAQKRGVRGDQGVIDAREALADANIQVRNSAEAVTDAQNQMREAQYQLSRAEVNATEAKRRLRDAELDRADMMIKTRKATDSGTAAQRKYNKMVGELTKPGLETLRILEGLYGWVQKLSRIAQKAFLPGLNDALRSLTTLTPLAEQGVADVGRALSDVARAFGDAFTSSEARTALTQIADGAAHATRMIGLAAVAIVRDLLPIVGQLFADSKPLITAFGDAVKTLGLIVGNALRTIASPPNISNLAAVTRGLADLVGAVVGAVAVFTGPMVGSLRNALPSLVDGVGRLATGFMRMLSVLMASGVIQGFAEFLGSIGDGLSTLANNGTLRLLGESISKVLTILGKGFADLMADEGNTQAFHSFLRQIPLLIQSIMRALPGLMEAFWAFISISVLFTDVFDGAILEAFALSLKHVAGMLYAIGGAVLYAQALWDRAWQGMGSIIVWFDDLLGGVLTRIVDKLDRFRDILGIVSPVFSVFAKVLKDDKNAKAAGALSGALDNVSTSAQLANMPLSTMGTSSMPAFNDVLDIGTGKTQDLSDALATLRGKINDEIRAEQEGKRVAAEWGRAKDALSRSIQENGRKLTDNSKAARENRDRLRDATRASYLRMLQDIESRVPMEKAIQRHRDRTKALQAEFGKSKAAKDETQRLIDKYGKVPKNVRTLLATLGYKDVDKRLKELLIKQQAAKTGNSISRTRSSFEKQERTNAFASGGHVTGPGTATSDSIMARLSNGEFVIKADSVGKLGTKALDYINEKGQLPFPMYAKGGYVKWPYTFDVSKTKIDKKWLDQISTLGNDGAGMGYKWMTAALREKFPALPIYSDLRPGAVTASGRPSNHARGRALDLPPRMDLFNYISSRWGKKTLELIWKGASWMRGTERNIYHGKVHSFSEGLLNNHGVAGEPNAHIHWALRNGGYVAGLGGRTQDKVLAALSNGEYVMSAAATQKLGVSNLNAMNEWGKRSTLSVPRANMNLAGATDFDSGPQVVDASRNISMDVTVTEDHQVDMVWQRINNMM